VLKYLYTLSFICILILTACKKDSFTTDSSETISFSTDTLLFDTVFSTIGSSTRKFKIYNRNNESIKISSLKLAGGENSIFRLNVNGVPGISFKNLEIKSKDSMWVYADVTVDPSSTNLPYVVKDSLEFITNGNKQDVNLIAFGQNAIFHKAEAGSSSFLLGCNEVWNNDIPHVVYGIAVIDTGCTLTIKKGAKVFFHSNGAIVALRKASLKIEGTQDEPVILEGDRLEPEYANAAGQWQGLYLFPLSVENEINWAVIKNSRIGVQIDTVNSSYSSKPTLTIKNSIIKNCSSTGISGRGTYIEGTNCLIANCGEYCGSFALGGKYNFTNCTFANYTPNSTDLTALVLNNWFKDNNLNINPRDLDEANFTNCIIYGSQLTEIVLSKIDDALFNYQFKNCLIKASSADINIETSEFKNCLINKTPHFINTNTNNFNIGINSSAANKGDATSVNSNLTDLEFDLNNNSRISDSKPDIGAYEFIPE